MKRESRIVIETNDECRAAEVLRDETESTPQFSAEALSRLLPGERSVVAHLFGLDGKCKHTYAELARRYGVTVAQLKRVESRALQKLGGASDPHLDSTDKATIIFDVNAY